MVALTLVAFQGFEKSPIRQVGGFCHIVPLHRVAIAVLLASFARLQRTVRIVRDVAGNEVGAFFHPELVLNFFPKKVDLPLDPVGPLDSLGDGTPAGRSASYV